MKRINIIYILVLALFWGSCSENTNKQVDFDKVKEALALKPDMWINERVKNFELKHQNSIAGNVLLNAVQAHGTLERWFKNGPIEFRFDYVPVSGNGVKRTVQQIDTWSNRTVHQSVQNSSNKFGWDGQKSWVLSNDSLAFDFDTRFWALTPYYFVAQPFVFDGEGVVIESLGEQELFGENFDVVKFSFEKGTGDAPDDYYINYFDKQTHLLKAIKYIVSYPKRFKNGGHSPEKIMVITSYQEISGIVIAKTYKTYSTDDKGNAKDLITKSIVKNCIFLPNLKNEYFNLPKEAKVID